MRSNKIAAYHAYPYLRPHEEVEQDLAGWQPNTTDVLTMDQVFRVMVVVPLLNSSISVLVLHCSCVSFIALNGNIF